MKAGVCVWMCECNHSHLRCRVLIQLPVWRLTVAAQWYPVWPGSLCPPPPFPSPSQCCRCYITLPSAFSFSRVQHFLLLRAVFKVLFSPRGFHVELIFIFPFHNSLSPPKKPSSTDSPLPPFPPSPPVPPLHLFIPSSLPYSCCFGLVK